MTAIEDVLALAHAVAKSGAKALLINEDNSGSRWVPLEEAVASGKAFAVEPKPGLTALDLDSPELVSKGLKVKTWAETYLKAQTVLTASGKEGHRHLWIHLPSDLSESEFRYLLTQHYEIPASSVRHTQATRPPLSPHRKGLSVYLIDPKSVTEALRRLGPADTTPQVDTQSLRGRFGRLLREGDTEGLYTMPDGTPARHKMIAAIAVATVTQGFSRDWFITEILDPKNVGGQKLQELHTKRGIRAAIEAAGKEYDSAKRWVAENNITPSFNEEEFTRRITAYREAAEQASFTRSTDRDVLLALIRIGIKHSSYSPMASVRDLHMESGRAIATVQKALERLVAQDWLIKGEPVGRTNTYIFNLEMFDETSTYSNLGGDRKSMY